MLINLSLPPTNIVYSTITGVTEDPRAVANSNFAASYSVDNWVTSNSLTLKAYGTTIYTEKSNWGFDEAKFYFDTATIIPAGAKYKVTLNKFENAPNTKPIENFDLKVARKDLSTDDWFDGGCKTWCILESF